MLTQYFDGADTLCGQYAWYDQTLCIEKDTTSNNSWQIGKPQKSLFDSAATYPNAIVTDTLQPYPINDSSSFGFDVSLSNWGSSWALFAVQWKQKLDIEPGVDGGMVEFSTDGGAQWQNAFNNPSVYNFFGFDNANLDTLPSGDFVFSGNDRQWRDIWLCFQNSWLPMDTVKFRFTFLSDSVQTFNEGWMMDNFMAHITIFHTISEAPDEAYLKVFPNPASDRLFIETKKVQGFHLIEDMYLINTLGQVVDEWHRIPTKYFIETSKYPNGHYVLRVKTNVREESLPVQIFND